MNFMEILLLIFSAVILGIAVKVFFILRGVWRDAKSYKASSGNEALMAMERQRLKAKLLKIAGVVLGVATIVVGVYLELPPQLLPFAGGGVFCLFLVWSLVITRQYNERFKEDLVKVELAKVLDNLHYDPEGMLDREAIANLDFFRNADSIGGNDLITADYKGIHFSQCDMSVRERYRVTVTDSKGHIRTETRWRDIFKGRAMQFAFAGRFRGTVHVVKRDFGAAKVTASDGGWQKVETELDEFNRLFEVYAEDPLDAMAVLTPQMIEGIFFFSKALDVPSAFHFHENTMYAFMELTRETFDASHKRTLLEERKLLERDIALVTGFFDVMYFKPQGGLDTNGMQSDRSMDAVAERVATVAAAAGTSVAEKLLHKTSRATGRVAGKTIHYFPYAVIAVFLLSAVYTLSELPDGIKAGTTADAMELPTVAYLLIMGAITIPWSFIRSLKGYAVVSFLMLCHFLFLSANLG
ncbi:MAG: DUF3137 domain-containing protein [Desulfovibrio sp.]|jgi:hypothetical protein|nr:DUF3137 domain-containing protein [Desulfovibrio sp.]